MKRILTVLLVLLIATSITIPSLAEEKVTLTIMTVLGSTDVPFQMAMDEFKTLHPNVEFEVINTVNAELKKMLRIQMLSGSMPDITWLDNPDFSPFASSGYLMDITDMVADWEDMQYFYDAPLSSVTYKNRLYGLPFECNDLALIYNVDMLESVGKEPPTTWAEVEDICEALKVKGIYGLGIAAYASEMATFHYIPWLYAAGGSIDKLDTEPATKSLTYLTGLIEKGYMSKEVLGYTNGTLHLAFMGGQCAMEINGSWQVKGLQESDMNWGVVKLPACEAGGRSATCLGGYHVGITNDCKNPELALAFLKLLCGKEFLSRFAEINVQLPVRSDVAENPVFAEYPLNVFVSVLPEAVSRVNPFWPDMTVAVYTAVQEALSGEKTPEQALSDAEAINAPYWQY